MSLSIITVISLPFLFFFDSFSSSLNLFSWSRGSWLFINRIMNSQPFAYRQQTVPTYSVWVSISGSYFFFEKQLYLLCLSSFWSHKAGNLSNDSLLGFAFNPKFFKWLKTSVVVTSVSSTKIYYQWQNQWLFSLCFLFFFVNWYHPHTKQ